jgi:large subunit ribosomal protein L29
MSLLRMKDLRALNDDDLRRRIGEIENDLLRERGIAAMGGAPPSPGRMRALRTNVARALTVMNDRRRAAQATTSARAPARAAPRPTTPPTAPPPRAPRARTSRARAPRPSSA